MNLPKKFYKMLVQHCGNEKNIKATTTTSLRMMKEGKQDGITTNTLTRICKENGVKAEVSFTHVHKGEKKVTTFEIS